MKTLNADPPDLERLALDVLAEAEECSRVGARFAAREAERQSAPLTTDLWDDLFELPKAELRYWDAFAALSHAFVSRVRAHEQFSASEAALLDQVARTPAPCLVKSSGYGPGRRAARSKGGAA